MENNKEQENYRNEIYSKSVRAGKRTYFFDVKSTRSGDHYLTITESKKKYDQDGNFHFEKHKLFLYKEDFDKFKDGLVEVIDKVVSLNEGNSDEDDGEALESKSFNDVDFEDLD
jgi:hypothetical protein